MAKKKRQRSSAAITQAGDSANVRQAVRQLGEFYRLGLRVIKADQKDPKRPKHGKGISLRFAEELGVERDYIDKARTFASKYSQKEFEELCSLRQPDGMPLSRKHVSFLLSVKDKDKRKRLQRRVAKEGWGTRRLGEEITKVEGRQSSGGRRPRAPETVDDALTQTVKMAESWLHWYGAVESTEGETPSLRDLTATVRKRLSEAMEKMESLRDSAERCLDKQRIS